MAYHIHITAFELATLLVLSFIPLRSRWLQIYYEIKSRRKKKDTDEPPRESEEWCMVRPLEDRSPTAVGDLLNKLSSSYRSLLCRTTSHWVYHGAMVACTLLWITSLYRLYFHYFWCLHFTSKKHTDNARFLKILRAYEMLVDDDQAPLSDWFDESNFVHSAFYGMLKFAAMVVSVMAWTIVVIRLFQLRHRFNMASKPKRVSFSICSPKSILLHLSSALRNDRVTVYLVLFAFAVTLIYGRLQGRLAQSIDTDPYHILGVSRYASQKELAKAYRRLSLRYHPDR